MSDTLLFACERGSVADVAQDPDTLILVADVDVAAAIDDDAFALGARVRPRPWGQARRLLSFHPLETSLLKIIGKLLKGRLTCDYGGVHGRARTCDRLLRSHGPVVLDRPLTWPARLPSSLPSVDHQARWSTAGVSRPRLAPLGVNYWQPDPWRSLPRSGARQRLPGILEGRMGCCTFLLHAPRRQIGWLLLPKPARRFHYHSVQRDRLWEPSVSARRRLLAADHVVTPHRRPAWQTRGRTTDVCRPAAGRRPAGQWAEATGARQDQLADQRATRAGG